MPPVVEYGESVDGTDRAGRSVLTDQLTSELGRAFRVQPSPPRCLDQLLYACPGTLPSCEAQRTATSEDSAQIDVLRITFVRDWRSGVGTRVRLRVSWKGQHKGEQAGKHMT